MKITETDLFFNKGFVEGMKSERKKIIEEIEKLEKMDIYFNKEQALKVLVLVKGLINGEYDINKIKKQELLNSLGEIR